MKKALLSLLLFLSSPSLAKSPVSCIGIITNTWVDNSGLLLVNPSWANKPIGLCNVTTKHSNVEPETCKAWVSIALSATASSKPTRIQYYNVNSCSDIMTYSASQPARYLMIGQ